jgi:hypothetical protein
MVILPHPPSSLDLIARDFALFLNLKIKLKRRRFESVSDIQQKLQTVLDSINENDFRGVFEAWKRRWDRCIHSQGSYFEG